MKTNTTHQTQLVRAGAWLRTLAGLALVAASAASALANDNRAPEVPGDIAVEDGNKVHFHGFGVGVQIYRLEWFHGGVRRARGHAVRCRRQRRGGPFRRTDVGEQ